MRKKEETKLSLALITDIHNGPDHLTKKGTQAISLLQDFCDFAGKWKADLVVDLGDRISDTNAEDDCKHLNEVATVFQSLNIERMHLLGNHDQENLKISESETILGTTLDSKTVEVKGFTLICFQANISGFLPSGLNLTEQNLSWLTTALQNAKNPCIIFTHVPLDSGSMEGNFYFAENKRFATYPEAKRAREIIEASNKVVLCVSGHVHWHNTNIINGIPYISLNSLTESSTTPPEPNGGWATLEIDETITWTTYGLEPVTFKFQLQNTRRPWIPPLKTGFISQEMSKKTLAKNINNYKAFLFDLDGVFYRGQTPLPGGRKVLNILQRANRSYMAITNNGQQVADDFSKRLTDMDINLPAEKILTSADILVNELKNKQQKGSALKVHILGSQRLKNFLAGFGIVESFEPDFVISAWSHELELDHLNTAVRYLLNGAELLATNADPLIPTQTG